MKVPSTRGMARWSARRPWRVVALWVVMIVLAVVASGALPSPITSDQSFTNKPESVKGRDLIEQRLRGAQPATETVVITSDHLTVDDPAFQQVVQETATTLRGLDGVVADVQSYLDLESAGDPAAAQLVSADRMTTILPVTLAGEFADMVDRGPDYVRAIESQGGEGVEVLSVGNVSGDHAYGAVAERDLGRAEMFGLPIALLILVVVFGALIAAGVPLVVALVSIVVTTGLATVVGQWYALNDITMNIIVMIGRILACRRPKGPGFVMI